MAAEPVGEPKHVRPKDDEVAERGSDCRPCVYEHSHQNRSSFSSFLSNFILGPTRRKWIAKKNSNDGNAEQADAFPKGGDQYESSVYLSEEKGSAVKTPRSKIDSRIPHVAFQSQKMDLLLLDEHPQIDLLKKTAWNGCSSKNRAQIWRLLLGYEPLEYNNRHIVLEAKRAKYREYVRLFCESDTCPDFRNFGRFDSSESQCLKSEPLDLCEHSRHDPSLHDLGLCRLTESSSSTHFACRTLRQINLDLPRTRPDVPIFHLSQIRNIMRRVLFLHSMLHPGKSYVQGMNEILTPLVVVYVSNLIKVPSEKGVEDFLKRRALPSYVRERKLDAAEADIFWVFSQLVSFVEDNFISEQPGILKRISRLHQIVSSVDPTLASHLTSVEVEFLQFAYRWMNCLLMRELPLPLVVHVWDALLAEDDGVSDLLVYLCAALMVHFSDALLSMDFEEAILFLQHLPTKEWTETNIDEMLSQAYQWKETLGLESLALPLPRTPSVTDVKRYARVS
ncbi:unnamed protein product [Agarophyton chilense]